MSSINFHTKEISVKIVYYGPGLCGKTTSLQSIYKSLPESRRNQFVSLATEVDRTIFFDFLPVTAYRIRDFDVRLQLYTVPGQVFYNATRKLVLNGVDGLIFVADSQPAMQDSNLESLQNLHENVSDLGMELGDVPMVIQANKRDLREIQDLEEMDRLYNEFGCPFFGTVATTGEGLLEGLKAVSQLIVNNLLRKGLGRQIAANERRKVDEAAAETGTNGGLSASVAAAAAAVASSAPPRPSLGMWPEGEAGTLGAAVDQALVARNWLGTVSAVEKLLVTQAKRWADAASYPTDDPLPAFLLLRGGSSERYRTFVQAASAARGGKSVSRGDAMSALILALQAIW